MKLPASVFIPDPPKRPGQSDALGFVLVLLMSLALGAGVATQAAAWIMGFSPALPGGGVPQNPEVRSVLDLLAPLLFLMAPAAGLLGFLLGAKRKTQAGFALLFTSSGLGALAYSLPAAYLPYQIGQWLFAFAGEPALTAVLLKASLAGGLAALAFGLSIKLLLGGSKWKTSLNFGSATWGRGEWLAKGKRPGLLKRFSRGEDSGLPLGKLPGTRRMLYDRSGGFATVCAPTGAGKTTGLSVPILLMHPGSAIAIDIKRELYHVTARRRHALNGHVHRLDPFGDQTASYNPMDLVVTRSGRDTLAIDEARMLTDMCIIATGRENSPVFINNAKELFTALILCLAYDHAGQRGTAARSLPAARRLLMLPEERLLGYLEKMLTKERNGRRVLPPAAREVCGQVADMTEKFLRDVLATARPQTAFLGSPVMQRVLTETNIQFSALKTGLATVFLVLPEDRLDTYGRWLRLMVRCAQVEIVRVRRRPKRPILFLVDELRALDRFDELQRGVSTHRAAGIQYIFVTQLMSDLKEIYGEKAKTFWDNPQHRLVWGASGTDAATYVSDMAGETTVATESASKNKGKGSRGISDSVQEKSRKLVTKDEAMLLPDTYLYLFTRGKPPLVLERPHYLTDPQFEGMYDPNPEHSTPEDFEKARRRRVELGIEAAAPPHAGESASPLSEENEKQFEEEDEVLAKASSGAGRAHSPETPTHTHRPSIEEVQHL